MGSDCFLETKDMCDHRSHKHTNIYVNTLERVKRGGESFITPYEPSNKRVFILGVT